MGSAHLALRCFAHRASHLKRRFQSDGLIRRGPTTGGTAHECRWSASTTSTGALARFAGVEGAFTDSHIMSRWLPRWFSCARPEFAHVHPVCERGMNVTDQSVWQYGFARNRSNPAAIAAAGRMGTHHAVSSMIGLPSVPSPSRRAERHLDDKLARALLGSVFSASLDRSGAV